MGLEFSKFDIALDQVQEIAETAQEKTSTFHENYISKIVPEFGKYGDAAKFAAEMVPGVEEYNAVKDGDWQAFAIAAGIDVAAIAVGAFTAGAGYGAVKGGSTAAKAGVKVAVKEVAEAGAKKAVKEVAEAGAEKAVKEAAEVAVKKGSKEIVEASAKKAVKEVAEDGAKKASKEVLEKGVEKAAKEALEAGTEKAMKEVAEAGAEKATKEVAEAGTEKAAKEVAEAGAEKAAKEAAEAGTEKTVKEVAETGVEKTVKEASENENVIIRYMECRNQGLEGKVHPETGVEFVRKTVDDGTGNFVEGVFPKFDSAFDAKLPEEMFDKSNFTQFKEANRQLVEKTEKDPSLLKFFTDEQFEQIVDGIKTGVAPDGFVWHHNEETGVLQLVDDLVHSITGHTGGRAIWGGGY